MIKCYLDKQGWPRASAPESESAAVAAYLEQDIQSSLDSVALVEDVILRVENGSLDAWEGTGNAFTVRITPALVTVQNEFDDSQVSSLSLEQFRKALESWKSLLEISPSGPHR